MENLGPVRSTSAFSLNLFRLDFSNLDPNKLDFPIFAKESLHLALDKTKKIIRNRELFRLEACAQLIEQEFPTLYENYLSEVAEPNTSETDSFHIVSPKRVLEFGINNIVENNKLEIESFSECDCFAVLALAQLNGAFNIALGDPQSPETFESCEEIGPQALESAAEAERYFALSQVKLNPGDIGRQNRHKPNRKIKQRFCQWCDERGTKHGGYEKAADEFITEFYKDAPPDGITARTLIEAYRTHRKNGD